MKNKKLFPIIAIASLLALTSCSLFNDDDIAVHNHYNPEPFTPAPEPGSETAGGVTSTTNDKVPNALYFKNVAYDTNSTIANTYATGKAHHTEYNVNGGNDYEATKATNNYDIYVPKDISKTTKHTVLLFIHGGAWVSGFKSDVNPYIQEFANKGYITATIKYTLLKKEMDDASRSIFRDLDEIDACIKSIKSLLTELEFDTTKTNLVLGGASSGAHLAMLYAYSRGNESVIPLRFVVDAVGPTNIKPAAWKKFVTSDETVRAAGITKDKIDAQEALGNIGAMPVAGEGYNWNDYQTMRISNGMCGLPYTLEDVAASSSDMNHIDNPNAASNSMTKVNGGEDQLSVTYWMGKTSFKPSIICAYAGNDSIVGINQYATLQPVMEDKGITHELFYFPESDHQDITREANQTVYDQFMNKIDEWIQAL